MHYPYCAKVADGRLIQNIHVQAESKAEARLLAQRWCRVLLHNEHLPIIEIKRVHYARQSR